MDLSGDFAECLIRAEMMGCLPVLSGGIGERKVVGLEGT